MEANDKLGALRDLFVHLHVSVSFSRSLGRGLSRKNMEKQGLFQQKMLDLFCFSVELEMHSRIFVVIDGCPASYFLEISLGTSRPTSRIPGNQALMLQALKVKQMYGRFEVQKKSQRGPTFIVVVMSFLRRDWLALDCHTLSS